jgi:8-oxo-dGTP diphosphatase
MSDRTEVALAILTQDGKFLMQLRDDIPTIIYPGVWGLFGGHMEIGETPEIAIKREILEEINYQPGEFAKFACYSDSRVVRHIFYAPLTVELDRLNLQEGWDLGLLTPAQILAGTAYSNIAGMERKLGEIHQKILADFIEWWGSI